MFIGHIPAGYISSKLVQGKRQIKINLILGMIAGILPDLDMFYFYFIDKRQHLHHSYWTHQPVYWLIIAGLIFAVLFMIQKKEYFMTGLIFFFNIFLHLFLDTIVGKIEWLYPFIDRAYYFFDVPAVYNYWVYNFIFHWTFLFEIVLIVWAVFIMISSRKKKNESKIIKD